jgi:hypothetical protein
VHRPPGSQRKDIADDIEPPMSDSLSAQLPKTDVVSDQCMFRVTSERDLVENHCRFAMQWIYFAFSKPSLQKTGISQ